MRRSPVVLGAFFLLFAVSGMVLMRQVSHPHVCLHTIQSSYYSASRLVRFGHSEVTGL